MSQIMNQIMNNATQELRNNPTKWNEYKVPKNFIFNETAIREELNRLDNEKSRLAELKRRYEYPPELYFEDTYPYSASDFKRQFEINDLNDATLRVSQVIVTAIRYLENYEREITQWQSLPREISTEFRSILVQAKQQISRLNLNTPVQKIDNCFKTIRKLKTAYSIIQIKYELYLRLGAEFTDQLFEKLSVVPSQPAAPARKKDFFMYIDELFQESNDVTQKPTSMGQCDNYWCIVLMPVFVRKKNLFANADADNRNEVIILARNLIKNKNKEIYNCFIKLYSIWKGGDGGESNMQAAIADLKATVNAYNQAQRDASPATASSGQQRQPAQAMLASGGGHKKKKPLAKKKKPLAKKTGVYHSKGGYFYRRYKNGKVKRISKETYKKSKKK